MPAQIVSTLARRAYRRPVADRDVQPLMDFYQASRKDESFDGAIEATLRRLLVSPDFLFRVERMPASASAATIPDQRRGSGVAPLVLPLEQRSGR